MISKIRRQGYWYILLLTLLGYYICLAKKIFSQPARKESIKRKVIDMPLKTINNPKSCESASRQMISDYGKPLVKTVVLISLYPT